MRVSQIFTVIALAITLAACGEDRASLESYIDVSECEDAVCPTTSTTYGAVSVGLETKALWSQGSPQLSYRITGTDSDFDRTYVRQVTEITIRLSPGDYRIDEGVLVTTSGTYVSTDPIDFPVFEGEERIVEIRLQGGEVVFVDGGVRPMAYVVDGDNDGYARDNQLETDDTDPCVPDPSSPACT